MGRRPHLVVFHDADPGVGLPWLDPILRWIWQAGAAIDRTEHSYGVKSWNELIERLHVLKRFRIDVHELHLWSHGGPRYGPYIGRTPAQAHYLRAIKEAAPNLRLVWWRSCSTADRYDFFKLCQRAMPDVTIVGHCAVISLPLPWRHRQGVALRPDEEPWWPLNKAGQRKLPGCSALRMDVPDKFYRS